MKQDKLSILSSERLKHKKRIYISLLTAFAMLLSALIVLTSFMYFTSGFTPLLIVPLGLFPLFVIGCRKLRAIYKEIEFRSVSSSRIE
ncbi:hypothetical protein [Ancylomarina euxinus]|uniref:hypothetical protein n=1 Tax=Ancylomarina euxinus TaxID=2283627 RepID=UPI0012E1B6F8|nr:hypothetical protein [Ancylomarina euxinus]